MKKNMLTQGSQIPDFSDRVNAPAKMDNQFTVSCMDNELSYFFSSNGFSSISFAGILRMPSLSRTSYP